MKEENTRQDREKLTAASPSVAPGSGGKELLSRLNVCGGGGGAGID